MENLSAPREKKIMFWLTGGIGDLLLEMEWLEILPQFLTRDQFEIMVISHAKGIKPLFDHLDYEFTFVEFSSHSQKKEILALLSSLEKERGYEVIKLEKFFTSLDIRRDKYLSDRNKLIPRIRLLAPAPKDLKHKTIAIHPFGSKFSNEYLTSVANFPPKDIPSSIVKGMIDFIDTNFSSYHIYVLGLSDEIDTLELEPSEHMTLIRSNSILESFSIVENCDLLIGADSAMKSYSCMRKIPSIVFLGDYKDPQRDSKFIQPYFDEGVIYPIYFNEKIDNGDLEVCQILIKTLLS